MNLQVHSECKSEEMKVVIGHDNFGNDSSSNMSSARHNEWRFARETKGRSTPPLEYRPKSHRVEVCRVDELIQ